MLCDTGPTDDVVTFQQKMLNRIAPAIGRTTRATHATFDLCSGTRHNNASKAPNANPSIRKGVKTRMAMGLIKTNAISRSANAQPISADEVKIKARNFSRWTTKGQIR